MVLPICRVAVCVVHQLPEGHHPSCSKKKKKKYIYIYIVTGGANDRHSGCGVRPRRGFY